MYLVRNGNDFESDGAGDPESLDTTVDAMSSGQGSDMDVPAADYDEVADRRRRFQLARVLKVTGEMMDHANANRWQQVEELELLRRVELEACFSLQGSQASPLVAEAMATLMYLNDQLVQLVRYARGQLRDSHGAQSKAFSAVKAYEEMR